MDYNTTLKFLYQNLPMYQRSGKAAYRANLDNTHALDKFLGHPHRKYKTIHIAGTNGKGSVSHMLASVLQAAGYKTGLYTSPHLLDFRERIKINGEMISEKQVIEFVNKMEEQLKLLQPSFFEMTVAMAFDYFASENTAIAVIETGMGGRLDSTNIVTPEVSVITNISLDHTEFLGDTVEKIAVEKGGIVKDHVPLITGKLQENVHELLENITKNHQTTLIQAEQQRKFLFQTMSTEDKALFYYHNNSTKKSETVKSDLTGSYQSENIAVALAVIDHLKKNSFSIPNSAIENGLENVKKHTGIRGRWETIGFNPRIITDTAHNEGGIRYVIEQLKHIAHKKLHIIWGMVGDKPAAHIFPLLPKNAQYYLTEPSIPRAMPVTELLQHANTYGLSYNFYSDLPEAFAAAKKAANPEDTIFIGGSTFIVADLLANIQND